MGDDRSHTVKSIQRRVIIATLSLAVIALLIGVPLVIDGDLRLNVAHRLHLAPGWDAERIASSDDGVTLVVLPLEPVDGMLKDRYRYKAQYLARPEGDGTLLSEIGTDRTLSIPLRDFDFIAADPDGAHVLFREGGAEGAATAVLVDVDTNTATTLPEGQTAPDLPGDWTTPVWEKTTGRCDRFSVTGRYIACFNRADLASYLAGDWQIDVQVTGDFRRSAPAYRGAGFLPIVGWASDDSALYLQNEKGIWRVPRPADL
jgi:hypothetical protein